MRTLRLGTRVVILTATVFLAASTAAASAASASATSAIQASVSRPASGAGGPGHWTEVTPAGPDTIADIGLARGGHSALNVIWASGITASGRGAIHDTVIGAGGAVGKARTIVGSQFLLTYPDAAVSAGRVFAIWNGIAKNSPSSPEGTFISSRPIGGGAWSAPANIPPLPAIPDTSSSDSATMGADGRPWVAFDGTDSLTVDHVGQPEHEIPPTACCAYNAGLAVDGKSGATFIAYQSLVTRHEGVFAQRLNQSGTASGTAVLLPGSVRRGHTPVVSERIAITGRGHGRSGVYALYLTNYPAATAVDLLRIGSRKTLDLAKTSAVRQFAGAALAADPAGALWAAWFTGNGAPASLYVRASNAAATKWGRTVRVSLPSGTSRILKVYISAQNSRADVLALLTRHGKTAYWTTQVR
jgi:hypothetical protein